MQDAISGFPKEIPYKGHMVVRGEATISYTDFKLLNDTIEDDDEKYANPRNLASGTLNLDDVEEVKRRHVVFYAFTLVHIDDDIISWGDRMSYLSDMKFNVVKREATDAAGLDEAVNAGQGMSRVAGWMCLWTDLSYAMMTLPTLQAEASQGIMLREQVLLSSGRMRL